MATTIDHRFTVERTISENVLVIEVRSKTPVPGITEDGGRPWKKSLCISLSDKEVAQLHDVSAPMREPV